MYVVGLFFPFKPCPFPYVYRVWATLAVYAARVSGLEVTDISGHYSLTWSKFTERYSPRPHTCWILTSDRNVIYSQCIVINLLSFVLSWSFANVTNAGLDSTPNLSRPSTKVWKWASRCLECTSAHKLWKKWSIGIRGTVEFRAVPYSLRLLSRVWCAAFDNVRLILYDVLLSSYILPTRPITL